MTGCYQDFEVKETNWMQISHITLQQITEGTKQQASHMHVQAELQKQKQYPKQS